MLKACHVMGDPLGIADSGDLRTDCTAMVAAIRNGLRTGLKPGKKLRVVYKPSVCRIDIDAAAVFVASCEAKTEAQINARCSGVCEGRCEGTQTQGRCDGICHGQCVGDANFDASASCAAKAKVDASAKAVCSEPTFEIVNEPTIVVDKQAIASVSAALTGGLPAIARLGASVEGPITDAYQEWMRASKELAGESGNYFGQLGEQTACVSAQLGAAASALSRIRASISIQVEISASVNASYGATGGTGH